jgi:hypothetical protein
MDSNMLRPLVLSLSILIAMTLPSGESLAQVRRVWMNPGFKITHTFGEPGGMTVGAEISLLWERNEYATGVLVAIDHCRSANRLKLHLGVEGHLLPFNRLPLGAEFGPSVVWTKGNPQFGFGLFSYTSIVLVPTMGGTFLLDGTALAEIGMLFKIPLRTSGRKI